MENEIDIFDEFANALRVKFNQRSKKGDNRSKEPWKEFDYSWLEKRHDDEWDEYHEAPTHEEKSEEALDVGEFSMFLWKKHQIISESTIPIHHIEKKGGGKIAPNSISKL
jgi:hypothetical protein